MSTLPDTRSVKFAAADKQGVRWRWFLLVLAASLYLGLSLMPARVHGGAYYSRVFVPLFVAATFTGVYAKVRGRSVLLASSMALILLAPFVAIPLMIALINFVQS